MDLLSVLLDAFVFFLFLWLGIAVLHSQRQEYNHSQREFLRYCQLQQQERRLRELLDRQQRLGQKMQVPHETDPLATPLEELEISATHPDDIICGGQPVPGTGFYFRSTFDGIWNDAVLIRGWLLTPREFKAIDAWLFDALEHAIVSADNGILVLGFERATDSTYDSHGRQRSEPNADLIWEDLTEVLEGLRSILVGPEGMPVAMPQFWQQTSLERWIMLKAAEMRRTYIESA